MSFERLEPGTPEWTAYYANHHHRYAFAADYLAALPPSSRVLDAATGVGYGAAHIAATRGLRVVAVDRDPAALQLARTHFAQPLVEYEEDDCGTLDRGARKGAPYAAAISFETVEHLRDPRPFLRRLADLIAPGGTLLVSTPNATVTLAERGKWDQHEREYTAGEFAALVESAGFASIRLFGQRLSPIGALRRDIRGELNRLRSNPIVRFGFWLQQHLRGLDLGPALPEQPGDFEIEPLESAADCERRGPCGPFVLIAAATRPRHT
jgi:SAM-dependent methyltransferase